MARPLVIPLIAALVAGAIGYSLASFAIPGLPRLSPYEAALAGGLAFFLLLALASHAVNARLAARIEARLGGLDAFDSDLRKRVTRLEARIGEIAEAAPKAAPAGEPQAKVEEPASEGATVIPFEARGRGAPQARLSGERLDQALGDDAIEAWFQPVVTLPGRKTRFFEASPHLRGQAGGKARRLDPGYAGAAEIDRRMLTQSLTLLRELDRAEKALGVIWQVHLPLLDDATAFSAVERMLEANRAFAGQLICRIDHRDHGRLDQAQADRLHRIRALGFEMALGNCPAPTARDAALESGLFSILMIDAARLVASRLDGAAAKSHTARGLGRGAAEIVASNVTGEEQAVALIDLDVMLAQGDFFSPPRPPRRQDESRQAAEI